MSLRNMHAPDTLSPAFAHGVSQTWRSEGASDEVESGASLDCHDRLTPSRVSALQCEQLGPEPKIVVENQLPAISGPGYARPVKDFIWRRNLGREDHFAGLTASLTIDV